MRDFASLVDRFLEIINLIIPLLFAVALLITTWKVGKALVIDGDPGSIEAGKKTVVVAVIVFVFMFGVWGIVQILRESLL